LTVACIAQHRQLLPALRLELYRDALGEWTAGGGVPDEVLDNLLNVLDHGLPPRSEDGPYRLKA
jgi:hypothetical protein